ncbi:MAG: ribose 5-phosphate isomerase A [Ignavibacteriales bacterium]|nr:ribose 5-phosphate isomerase A [Ignavibacteriales bacterium]
MNINELKKLAAEKAVEEISSGMIVGLGTGSTVQFALEKISERIKNGELKNIVGIPSSLRTEKEATRLEIPITTLNEVVKREKENGGQKPVLRASEGSEVRNQKSEIRIQYPASSIQYQASSIIDLTIDGADEIDNELNLIKGGGGALLHEKILAQASKRLIIITDETKLSKHLGTKRPVPVEVLKFSAGAEQKFLESLNAKVELRKNSDGSNYITDENNFILDADFGKIKNVKDLSNILNDRAGIAGHGLFVGLTDKVICAMDSGEIRIQKPVLSRSSERSRKGGEGSEC